MARERDYSPFDRYNERWPTKGDRVFAPGRDAWPANSVGERAYRLGRGYKLAGDTLVQNIFGEVNDHDDLIYPILYCYRHYVEITLKEIIEKHGPWVNVSFPKKDHKLPELWERFLKVAIAYGNDPADIGAEAVSACIDEFSACDPVSVAFRYATERRTGALISLQFDTINLVNLNDVMNGIANFFECAELDFTHKRDAACEASKVLRVTEAGLQAAAGNGRRNHGPALLRCPGGRHQPAWDGRTSVF